MTGPSDGRPPGPVHHHPSARVRLEAALLDAERTTPPPAPAAADGPGRLTILVVAAEADLRRYVRECLREHPERRVVEAATVVAATALATALVRALAAAHTPTLLVVGEEERDALAACPAHGAVLLVDEVPHGAPVSGGRVELLARPFSADALCAAIDRLIGERRRER